MFETAAATAGARASTRARRFAPRRRRKTSAVTVVVVDDDIDSKEALAEMLEASGYHVERAIDGADALRLARTHRPDAMVVDLSMPVMDGFEVAQRMKAEALTRAIPLVAVTGKFPSEASVQGRAYGRFAAVLLKPLPASELLREVRRLTRH